MGSIVVLLNTMKKLFTTFVIAAGVSLLPTLPVQAEPYYGHEGHEHHSEIHAALHALEVARDRLQHANHDFGGHREAALRACNEAIEQLRLSLQFDR